MSFRKDKINKVPKHIAFIIDGNGRWAQKLQQSRSYGHLKGMERLKKVIQESFDYGIDIVSIFGFSTENWNRPQKEVEYLFKLFKDFADKEAEELYKNNIRVMIMGDYKEFPEEVAKRLSALIEKTKTNTGKVLNLGLNYGGRKEITKAINELIKSGVSEVSEKSIEKYLYTAGLPDPDFVIRTSGEQRISNFMLWQCAYSELYFPKVHWPGFTKKHLEKALLEFQKRNRRFGAIVEKEGV